jgi:hypothetical protein
VIIYHGMSSWKAAWLLRPIKLLVCAIPFEWPCADVLVHSLVSTVILDVILGVSKPNRPHLRRQLFNVLAKVMHEARRTVSISAPSISGCSDDLLARSRKQNVGDRARRAKLSLYLYIWPTCNLSSTFIVWRVWCL